MKLLLLFLLLFSFVNAGESDITEKLGAMVPLNLKFINSNGQEKTLKQLMNAKPTLLTLNYYQCAGICTTELEDLADTLAKVDLKEGKDYQVVTVSFIEDETPALAKHKKTTIIRSMLRPFASSAWSFVIGENGSSKVLADAVGFHFSKSGLASSTVQYAHGTGTIALSPSGKITRYLRGIHQLPIDIKMAVLDAAKGRVTPSIPKQLQACSAYHPKEKYTAPTEEIVGIIISLVTVGFFIRLLFMGKKKRGNMTKEEYYKKEEENENQKSSS